MAFQKKTWDLASLKCTMKMWASASESLNQELSKFKGHVVVASEQGGYTVPKAPFARRCLKTGTGVIPRPWLDDSDRLGR